jgi:hypothetical protein
MMKINLLFEPHYVKNKHIKKIKIKSKLMKGKSSNSNSLCNRSDED